MKLISYCLLFAIMAFFNVQNISAQVAKAKTLSVAPKSESPKKVASLLPPKKIQLLYEIEDLKDDAFLENLENPDALAFEEIQLDQQVHELRVLLHLFSPANIQNIHVKIGSSIGATDFAAYSFPFDAPQDVAAPFSYVRDGKTVVLGMGQVVGIPRYQVEVILEGRDGQRSEPAYFTTE